MHPEDVPCHGDGDPLSMDLTSHVGSQVIGIKVEEVTDLKEDDDLGQIKSPVIKTEPEVSCVCVCSIRHILQISRIASVSVCMST